MLVVEVTSESRYPVDRQRIREVVMRTLKVYGVGTPTEVSVRVVGDRKMKFLNETYRKQEGTTDVLSFPTETSQGRSQGFVYPTEEAFPLGDIVISFPQARSQAAACEVLVDDEIDALIEHGVKSLLGHHPDAAQSAS